MFCAISGKPPKTPVLSPVSKCVFEKSLIEQYINETSKDPITNEFLSIEQLIPISQTPQQITLTNTLNSSTLNSNYSIPNLLSSLQNEWDAIMLENFKLRKQLDDLTKQLSTSFYERDAAKLVAAKLMRERDQIVGELNKLTKEPVEEIVSTIEVDNNESFIDRLKSESEQFVIESKSIKQDKFKLPVFNKIELINTWNVLDTNTIFETTNGGNHKKLLFSDENNSIVIVHDSQNIKKTQIDITNNSPNAYVTSTSNDDTLIMTNDKNQLFSFNTISDNVIDYPFSKDNKIIFIENHKSIVSNGFLWVNDIGQIGYNSIDVDENYIIKQSESVKEEIIDVDLHKDGLLMAFCKKTSVLVYNLTKPEDEPTIFQCNKEIPNCNELKSVKFSSNGYWMIVNSENSLLVFDLRKQVGTVAVGPFTIAMDSKWDIDPSGKYLATFNIETSALQLYSYKKSKTNWELVTNIEIDVEFSPSEPLKSLKFLCSNDDTSIILQTTARVFMYSCKINN